MRGALLLAAVLGLAAGVNAYVPPTGRIANAVAKQNEPSGRTTTLTLQVELQFEGDTEPAAAGMLSSSPEGVARLELRSPRGFTERHRVAEGRSEAARDGQALAEPRSLLPPFYLLQAGSGAKLRTWLLELGGGDQTALGYEGNHDCYVIGGRDPVVAPGSAPGRTALWVDQESLGVVRIDVRGGARFRFGPAKAFGDVLVPSWIEVEEPGQTTARLRVLGARSSAAAPGAFEPAWLLATPPVRPAPPPPAPDPAAQ